MLQTAVLDCQFLDLFPFWDDGFVSPKVDIRRCDVAQALVGALGVIILDEGPDLTFKITGQIVVLQQHTVFHDL